MMADEETKLIQDRDIIDMIKHNMLQDEIEYTNLLKDYISFLKDEIIYPNKFIFDHLNTVYKHEETRSSQGIQVKSPKDLVNVNDVSLNVAANKSQSTPRVNTIINYDDSKSLITDDNINNNDIEYINCEKDVICIDNRWITERRKNKKNLIQLTQD